MYQDFCKSNVCKLLILYGQEGKTVAKMGMQTQMYLDGFGPSRNIFLLFSKGLSNLIMTNTAMKPSRSRKQN